MKGGIGKGLTGREIPCEGLQVSQNEGAKSGGDINGEMG